MKRNYKMTVSYDGTRYYGWEHQPGQEWTIQGKLETVLSRMLQQEAEEREAGIPQSQAEEHAAAPSAQTAFSVQAAASASDGQGPSAERNAAASLQLPVTVIGAGRTDAGVHALAMTANVLLDTEKSEEEIRDYMNRYLPDDISVNELKICADRFHSRFKAIGKTYRYTCWTGSAKPVFDRKYVTVLEICPDTTKMRQAAALLTGMHDYKSFCGNSHMKKSTIRVVDSIEIRQKGNYLTFTIHGNGFLQNMVRIMVGTLLEVGYGRRSPESMTELLEAKNRVLAGRTAPAKGLCLIGVDY